nr:hypothetical protein Iba_chr03aCG20560 [Ipomoea batatas]
MGISATWTWIEEGEDCSFAGFHIVQPAVQQGFHSILQIEQVDDIINTCPNSREQQGQKMWETMSEYGASTRLYLCLSLVLYLDPMIHWEHKAGIINRTDHFICSRSELQNNHNFKYTSNKDLSIYLRENDMMLKKATNVKQSSAPRDAYRYWRLSWEVFGSIGSGCWCWFTHMELGGVCFCFTIRLNSPHIITTFNSLSAFNL